MEVHRRRRPQWERRVQRSAGRGVVVYVYEHRRQDDSCSAPAQLLRVCTLANVGQVRLLRSRVGECCDVCCHSSVARPSLLAVHTLFILICRQCLGCAVCLAFDHSSYILTYCTFLLLLAFFRCVSNEACM